MQKVTVFEVMNPFNPDLLQNTYLLDELDRQGSQVRKRVY